MSLMEMLVGLAILGLILALALGNLGPWLSTARRTDGEAAFWRAVEPAQLILAELTAGAIDADAQLSVSPTRARFRAIAPAMSASPVVVDLRIEDRRGDKSQRTTGQVVLLLSTSVRPAPSVLLASERPLRLRRTQSRALAVDALANGAWAPLLVAPMPADAPLRCEFDFIARSCR